LLQFPSTFADLDDVQAIELSVVFGLPGLLLGLAIGVVIRHWAALALIAVCGAVAVRYGTQHLLNGPGDNDPRIIWGIALVANFIGLLIGAAAARLLSGLRRE
jgi:hypothetical protein